MRSRIETAALDRHALIEAFVTAVRDSLTKNRTRQLAMIALLLESTSRPVLREELTLVAKALRGNLERLCARAGIALSEPDSWALLSFFNGSVFIGLTLPQLEEPADETIRAGVTALLGSYSGAAPSV